MKATFPLSYHNEVNEDGIMSKHPGYREIRCAECEQTFILSKLYTIACFLKCTEHGGK